MIGILVQYYQLKDVMQLFLSFSNIEYELEVIEKHIKNIVKIDVEYYHPDATWMTRLLIRVESLYWKSLQNKSQRK